MVGRDVKKQFSTKGHLLIELSLQYNCQASKGKDSRT